MLESGHVLKQMRNGTCGVFSVFSCSWFENWTNALEPRIDGGLSL